MKWSESISINKMHNINLIVARSDAERDQIFDFRYKAYRKGNVIEKMFSNSLQDEFDDLDNCYIFGLFLQAQLVSTVRIHVLSKVHPISPAFSVFPEHITPWVDQGHILIDPTRLATDDTAVSKYKALPYLTLKAACMGVQHFSADFCLATVREEHIHFYKNVFQFEEMGVSRKFPNLIYPSQLMVADINRSWKPVLERYPIFKSCLLYTSDAADE